MSHTVRVAPTAARELAARLPDVIGAACLRFVYGSLAADPHGVGTPLRAPFEGYWTTERGEYRLYYRIDDDTQTIDILDLSHRNQLAIRALLG